MNLEGRIVHRSRGAGGVIEVVDEESVRFLHFATPHKQSAMVLDDPNQLVLPYTRHMMGALLFGEAPRRVLMVGLGGGSMARFLLHHFPECRMDVVEPSRRVVRVAKQFFSIHESTRLVVHLTDGARFAANASSRLHGAYDLILVDAFDREGMAWSVYSRTFFDDCRLLLSRGGVMTCNLSSTNWGDFKMVLDRVTERFSGAVLKLPVAHSNNEIVFAFNDPDFSPDWHGVRVRAVALEAHLAPEMQWGLDFSAFIRKMIRVNIPLWRRLLPFG
ncbi:MAG: spermine synthase [Magnetococcales bacterium]|nr:spermine synthase [Magnetococcales bacterium]